MHETLEIPGFQAVGYDKLVMARAGEQVAAAPFQGAVAHPLGAPTVSGTTITVDIALNQPTRITRMLMDLTFQRFFVDRVFASGGGVTGGAVIFDPLVANDLYLDRDVQRVAPGGEFPILTSSRRAPSIATPEKWGGKVFVTDEARDRNDVAQFTNQLRQLANTIVRKINQRGVETLEAAFTANPSRVLVGVSWSTVVTAGSSASSAALWPGRDFAKAAAQAEIDEMGMEFDLWIMNPTEYFNLSTVYGPNLATMLGQAGVDLYVTNRVTAGTAYVVASNQAGQMRIEKPLSTETWREQKTQRTWVQSDVRPLWFVDNPFAILKFTGLT